MRISILAAPFAILGAAAVFAISAAPAVASADACAAAPAKLRALAATADADAQRRAVRQIDLGEALCEARNRSEAARKFSVAAKALGTDLATVLAQPASAAAL